MTQKKQNSTIFYNRQYLIKFRKNNEQIKKLSFDECIDLKGYKEDELKAKLEKFSSKENGSFDGCLKNMGFKDSQIKNIVKDVLKDNGKEKSNNEINFNF